MVWNKRGHGTTWKVSEYGVFSSPYFSVFGLNTEIYGVNLRIHSEYRKIQTRKNSVFGFFSRSVGSSLCILHMYSLNLCITCVHCKSDLWIECRAVKLETTNINMGIEGRNTHQPLVLRSLLSLLCQSSYIPAIIYLFKVNNRNTRHQYVKSVHS